MRALLALALVAACSSAPPEPLAPPGPRRVDASRIDARMIPVRRLPAVPLFDRPSIRLATVAADTNIHRPWPLTELPSLQPHLDLAMAHDLCTAWPARNKHTPELVEYGAAWCRIRTGERGTAVDALAKLAAGARTDIMKAARLDVINLVVIGYGAKAALARIDHLRLNSVDNFDLMAATYGALGLHKDAQLVIDRAWSVDWRAPPQRACERALAWWHLDADTAKQLQEIDLDHAGTCGRRALATSCALQRSHRAKEDPGARLVALRECFNEFPAEPALEDKLWIMIVVAMWPRDPVQWNAWVDLARFAENALGTQSAEDLAVTALDNAIFASDCEPAAIEAVTVAAKRIGDSDHHKPDFDRRIEALRTMNVERCEALHN